MPEGHKKTTILVFDCWLPGFTYIKDLADYSDTVSLVFVHSSSLQMGDPAREYKAFQQQYDVPDWVHDFAEFDYNFGLLFEQVKPDAVLVLSPHHIEARTALYFASQSGIPTYVIPHGIFFLENLSTASNAEKNNITRSKFLISKLPRVMYYTIFFWRFHLQRMRMGVTGSGIASALKCYAELISKSFDWQWRPSPDVQAYYAGAIKNLILYDSHVAHYYQSHYGAMIEGASVVVSGTLDIGRVVRYYQRRGSLIGKRPRRHCAYFISSPYTDYFTVENTQIYGEFVRNLKGFVEEAGYEALVYRPHPGEPADFTRQVRDIAGAELDMERGLTGLVESDLICGTSSSLLYSAVILKKPIVIAGSKRLKVDHPYYEPLLSYPTISFNADADIHSPMNRAALETLKSREIGDVPIDVSELRDPLADLVDMIRRQPRP